VFFLIFYKLTNIFKNKIMNQNYIIPDAWCIIEEGFDKDRVMQSESLFSLGNGAMGQRTTFEEKYSGKTFQGSYIGGVYYPDKTKVGWWKNGYPEYFAKVCTPSLSPQCLFRTEKVDYVSLILEYPYKPKKIKRVIERVIKKLSELSGEKIENKEIIPYISWIVVSYPRTWNVEYLK